MQQDREVVLEAVKTWGRVLEFASEELKTEREVVLEAVKQYGLALSYASEELQNDREVVLVAVKDAGHALEFASAETAKRVGRSSLKQWSNQAVQLNSLLKN